MKRVTLGLALILIGAGPVRAALESRDWLSPGDGLLTFDSNTGLEWLDVTLSTLMSVNDVLDAMAMGGDFEGFRYATASDVDALWLNLGWSGVQTGERTFQDGAMALAAFDLLGTTFSAWPGSTQTEQNAIYWEENGRTDRIGLGLITYDTDDEGRGFAWYGDDLMSFDRPSNRWGSYLVRDHAEPNPVPEPATFIVWSFLAFCGIAYAHCRMRRR